MDSLFDPKFSVDPTRQSSVNLSALKKQKAEQNKAEEPAEPRVEGKNARKKRKRREAVALGHNAPAADVAPVKKKSAKAIKEEEEKNERTIFIGGLPVQETTKKAIKKLLQTVECKVDSIRFRSIAFADTKTPKKYQWRQKELNPNSTTMNAYAVLKHKAQVELALQLNGHEFSAGFILRVDRASGSPSISNKSSVFVGNLPFDVQQSAVQQYFAPCGDIEYVRLIRDQKTGLGKGFAYVCFSDAQSVPVALQLHESTLAQRKIRVFRATSKPKRNKRGGGDTAGGRPGHRRNPKKIKRRKNQKQKKNRLNAT